MLSIRNFIYGLPLFLIAFLSNPIYVTPLTTLYTKSTASAIMSPGGDTRIYVLNQAGGILELAGNGSSGTYTHQVVVPANKVLPGSPVAAVTWGDDFESIRLYYISNTGVIMEYAYDDPQGWYAGQFSSTVQPGSGSFLYAMAGSPVPIRVGFTDNTHTIYESVFTGNQWQLVHIKD